MALCRLGVIGHSHAKSSSAFLRILQLAEDALQKAVGRSVRIDSIVAKHTTAKGYASVEDSDAIILNQLTEALILDCSDHQAQSCWASTDDQKIDALRITGHVSSDHKLSAGLCGLALGHVG